MTKPSFDWIAFLVVVFLGAIGLLLSGGIVYLAQIKVTPDAAYYTLAGTAIGALGSMLANGGHRQQAQRQSDGDPVEVSTPPNEPLQVTTTDPSTPPAGPAAAIPPTGSDD